MSATREVRVAPNIYKTPFGWRVYVSRRGVLKPVRFKPDVTLEELEHFRDSFKLESRRLRREARRANVVELAELAGTFEADATTYLALATVKAMPSYTDRTRDIGRWVKTFRRQPRKAITRTAIDQQLQLWRNAGYAASTVNNRRTALMALFTDLDGRSAANPVRDAKVFEEPELLARGIPYAYVLKILDAIPDARVYSPKPDAKIRQLKTKPRIEVMAMTGMRPSQIGRLERGIHFNVKERWYLIPRSKKGSQRRKPRTPRPMTRKHMTEAMAAVFQRFDDRDCYVTAKQIRHLKSGMRRAFREAMTVAEKQIRRELGNPEFRFPKGLKPYDLRHSFATEMLTQTNGNYHAVAELLDQGDTRHVRRYGLSAIPTVLKTAAVAFEHGTAHLERAAPTIAVSAMPKRRRAGKVSGGKGG